MRFTKTTSLQDVWKAKNKDQLKKKITACIPNLNIKVVHKLETC